MVVESRLVQGMQSFGSVRGVSSHQHNPFAGKCMPQFPLNLKRY